MTAESNRKPKKVEVLIVNDEAETPSFLNPMSGQIFVTNPIGKRLMELADGTRSLEQIGEELSREFKGAMQAEMVADATGFFEESHRKGLVTWTR
ncbi:MAG TPA: PqqD family protein [Longimicrobiaceae bacterium]